MFEMFIVHTARKWGGGKFLHFNMNESKEPHQNLFPDLIFILSSASQILELHSIKDGCLQRRERLHARRAGTHMLLTSERMEGWGHSWCDRSPPSKEAASSSCTGNTGCEQ